MKKFIFCCLVIFMGSCKNDDDNTNEPDPDYATEFVGSYTTKTADAITATDHLWEVTTLAKNQLGIVYTKTITSTVSGLVLKGTQTYNIINAVTTANDSFTINESVEVTQSTGTPLKQKVEGVAMKVVDSAGTKLTITLKLTNASTGVATEEYLEFKKQ